MTITVDPGETSDLRSYGRRRGRKASPRQEALFRELLPTLAASPANAALIAQTARERGGLWLEIGFGGGEHLLWQARHHPDVMLIGAEPFEDGVVKVLSAIEAEGLANIRLFADDVRPLIRALPDASVDRAFVLFPDPWPKRKHQKRRLVARPLLDLLARVLKPGAELRVATDIGDYARTMLIALMPHPAFHWTAESPADWRVRPPDWPPTRYEQKALREGRRGYFFTFRRV